MKKTGFIFIFLFLSLAAFSQSAEDLYKEGMRRVADKNYKEAEKFLTKAIGLCKDSAKYYWNRGKVYEQLEKFQQAYDDYTLAIQADKNAPLPYLYRAGLQIAQHPYEAIKDGNMAIMLSTVDSIKCKAYTNNGVARCYVRDFDGAYQDFMKVLAYDSLNIDAINNLGNIFEEKGDTTKAIWYSFKAHRIDTSLIFPMSNIGFIRSNAGNYKDAMPYFDWVLKRDPKAAFVYNNRGYAKMKMGDLKGALDDIDHSIKLLPSNSYAYRNRALVYLEMNKTKKACEDLHKAQELGFKQEFGNEVEKLIKKNCD